MAEYKISKFKYKIPEVDAPYESLSKMSYQSPIELMIGQMRFEHEKRIEGEVMKAVQDVGVTVNKDELIKALRYDREQYEKGFADGRKGDIDKLCQEVKVDTVREMQERLKAQKFTHKNFGELVEVEVIDQIAKEMLEEN